MAAFLKVIGWDRRLASLADRLDRMKPHRVNPDKYFEEKSEIVNELRKMSKGGMMVNYFTLYLVIGLIFALGGHGDYQKQCGIVPGTSQVMGMTIGWPAKAFLDIAGFKLDCDLIKLRAKREAQ